MTDNQDSKYLEELRRTYKEKTNEELKVFRENYLPSDYTPEARIVIKEIFKERKIDLEDYIKDKKGMESMRPSDYDHRDGEYAVKIQGQYYKLASLWKRLFGFILDGLIIYFFLMVTYSTGSKILYAISVVLFILYWLFRDGLKDGKSLGKAIVGTKVVESKSGNPCSLVKSCVRNIALTTTIDWIFILGSKRQRIGDKIASTYVINDRSKQRE
ncbi:MAG: RDD family protein [Elusimicrobiota bacterium]